MRGLLFRPSALFLALLALPACGGIGGIGKKTLSVEEALRQPYLIHIGDELEITVGGRSDSAVKTPVGDGGTVLFALVGEMQAAGRSIRELELAIEEKLKAEISSREEPASSEPARAVEILTAAEAFNQVYSLQAGDQLDISIWQHPELTQKTQIREDGTFTFPLLGSVQAAGRATADLEKELRERLDRDFIVNPQVTIRLTDAQFTVLGQKGDSGSHPIEGSIDLMTAISKAGDILTLQTSPVEVIRRQGNRQVVIRADVDRLLSGKDPNIPVLPRDTIYVKPPLANERKVSIHLVAPRFTALGEVNSPGSYVMDGRMDLLTAVSLAGGISKFGSTRVEIIRSIGDEKAVIRADLDRILKGKDPNFTILPRDTIYARRRLF